MNNIMSRCCSIMIKPGDYIRKHDSIHPVTGEMMYTIIIWEHRTWWDVYSIDSQLLGHSLDLSDRDLFFNGLCNGMSLVIGMQILMAPVEFDSSGTLSPANIMDCRVGGIIGGCDDD